MGQKIKLVDICYARAGDKGDISNIGLMAKSSEYYKVIKEKITPKKIKDFFGDMVKGKVEIYPLDNLESLEIVMHGALDGGATGSLRIDGTGKPYATAILRMEIEV